MGFGTYDESEQEKQEEDTDYDEDDAVNVHANDHDGDVSTTGGEDTTALVDRLQTMKDGDEA